MQGVTGSGKTFTLANIIQQRQRPALVLTAGKFRTVASSVEVQVVRLAAFFGY